MSVSPSAGGWRSIAAVLLAIGFGAALPAADITLPSGSLTGTPTYGPGNVVSTATSPDTTVAAGADVTVRSGRLVLNPGFHVQVGGVFRVQAVPYLPSDPVLGINPVTSTTTSVTIAAAQYIAGESVVTYSWDSVSGPGTPSFSPNGTNAAKSTTVTFPGPGSYVLRCRATGTDGLQNERQVSCTVTATLASIDVAPATVSVPRGSTYPFTATGKDQFNQTIAMSSPTWSVPATGGTMSAAGVFTPGTTLGTYTVTATLGSIQDTAQVTVTNAPPTVATAAAASPSPVTGTTATVSALGADDLGEGALIYTWATTGSPPASVTFSPNGTNAAKSSTATFTKAGTYNLRVTITDASTATVTSSITALVVRSTPAASSTLVLSPLTPYVVPGATLQFTASGIDQFGAPVAAFTNLNWSVTGGDNNSTISNTGLLTAGPTAQSPVTVTVQAPSGTPQASTTVEIGDPNLPTTSIYVIAKVTNYPTAGSTTGARVTSYQYTWWPESHQIAGTTTVMPAVATADNGANATTSVEVRFDTAGRPVWAKDGEGYLSYTGYDPLSGVPVSSITDAKASLTADFTTPLPSGWTTPASGGLHLKTLTVPDAFGRPTAVTDPKGNVTYTVYKDAEREVRIYPGWDTGTSKPTGPTRVAREDLGRGYRETLSMTATPDLSAGKPVGTEAISGIETLSREVLDENGRVVAQDVYRDKTAFTYSATTATLGSLGAAYERSTVAYDARGFAIRSQDAAGTISRKVLDTFGRPVSTWVGTDDAVAVPGPPWSPTNTGSAMYQVGAFTYYDNSSTTFTSTGLGQVATSESLYGDGDGQRYTTTSLYDWRGRLTQSTAPGAVITVLTVNNLDQVIQTDLYAGTVTGGNLRGRTTQKFDTRGQLCLEEVFQIDPTAGTPGNKRVTKHWYDRRGLRAKTLDGNGLFTKTRRDGAARIIRTSTAIDSAETTYAQALASASDQVASSTAVILDAVGNTVCVTSFQRKQGDTTTTGDLAPLNSLMSVSVNWFDKANRRTATVDYGRDNSSPGYVYNSSTGALRATNGLPTVVTTEPPAVNSSDNYRVSTVGYDAAGRVDTTTDNLGQVGKTIFNMAGQVTATIANYADGTPANADIATDQRTDFTVEAGGLVTASTARNATGSAVVNQTTTYLRESVFNKSLVTTTIYPDSGDTVSTQTNSVQTDQVNVVYDRLRRVTGITDQRQVVRTMVFDSAGRLFTDSVTTTQSIIDSSIRRIERLYDGIGRPLSVTSYSAATSGGTLLNQVSWTYDGWGNITVAKQAHSAAEASGTPPQVAYAWADGASGNVAKYNRLTSVTYPTTTRVVRRQYAGAAGLDDSTNRVLSLVEDLSGTQTTVAEYTYAGLGQIAKITLPVAGVACDYTGTSGDYSAYTRFWQTASHVWKQSTTAVDGFAATYDRLGSRTSRDYQWSHPANWDEGVTYDGLNRLVGFARGPLTAGAVPSGQAVSSETWTLDALGNWRTWVTDADGAGAGAAVTQTRAHNEGNEIDTTKSDSDAAGNAIASSTSSANWIDPVADKAGNLRSGPIPGNGTTRQHYVFDAWNRLVSVKADSSGSPGTTVWSAVYDGLHRRITTVAGGVTSDSYYSESWQELEVRVAGAATEALTWGLRGVDDLIRRHRLGGTADQATVVTDIQGSVTSLWLDGTGLVERYRYDPYGARLITDAAGTTVRTTSSYGMRYGYTGRPVDAESKLSYYRRRYYDTALGRFIGRDPAGAVDGYNLYAYVRGSPLLLTDPSGEKAELAERYLDLLEKMRAQTVYHEPTRRQTDEFNRMFDEAALILGRLGVQGILDRYVRQQVFDDSTAGRSVSIGPGGNFAPDAAATIAAALASRGMLPRPGMGAQQNPQQQQQGNAGGNGAGGGGSDLGPHAPGDVPNGYTVVRGGTTDIPPPGSVVSGAQGPTLNDAATGVPHGQLRSTTAGALREGGGTVTVSPQTLRDGVTVNPVHVDFTEGPGPSTFSPIQPNPAPKTPTNDNWVPWNGERPR